jgi:NAD(P)-dependent dehydrogenase (short-subunit alcohol dehydrogenase family)
VRVERAGDLERRGVDIAMPAIFLTSSLSRYITGSTLPVNGGFLCH